MKKFILLALALLSLSAVAQRRGDDRDGSLTLRDGRNIMRIEIGDDRDDRDMLRRVRRLEQAVRDLQDQVYQLQSTPVAAPRRHYVVCSGTYFRAGPLSARANTETEARASLMSQCASRANQMFCGPLDGEVRCERGQE